MEAWDNHKLPLIHAKRHSFSFSSSFLFLLLFCLLSGPLALAHVTSLVDWHIHIRFFFLTYPPIICILGAGKPMRHFNNQRHPAHAQESRASMVYPQRWPNRYKQDAKTCLTSSHEMHVSVLICVDGLNVLYTALMTFSKVCKLLQFAQIMCTAG